MDVDLVFPSGITELRIANGGHVYFNTNSTTLSVSQNTIIIIEDKNHTNVSLSTAPIYVLSDPCSNNKAIEIGGIKYSACTGGGNVCLLFSALIAQGGSLYADAVVTISGSPSTNGTIETTNPANTVFTLDITLANNSSFNTPATYEWSTVVGTPTPTIANTSVQDAVVTAYALGSYTFKVKISQSLNTDGCSNAPTQIIEKLIVVNIVQKPAPVTLITFDALSRGCATELSWVSATEENFSYYEVQRSFDGIAFTTLGKVAGKSKAASYTYIDNGAMRGDNFYRLKMVEKDGKTAYSKVVNNRSSCNNIIVSPSFITTDAKVIGLSGKAKVQIISGTGSLIDSKVISSASEIIDFKPYPAGVYLVIIATENGDKVFMQKVVKR